MAVTKKSSASIVAGLALLLALTSVAFGQETETSSPEIKIKNFGQMDDRFFRGARPKESDLKTLAALGINTVIDLTDNSREKEEPAVLAAGMRYINIPMVDKGYPDMQQINEFLKVINDPSTGKFFVHCAGGRHRTGVVGAVYRFNQHKWDYEQVMAEMNRFDFGSGFGHGKQKDFVQDYWKEVQAKQTAVAQQ